MQQTSELYKQLLAENGHTFEIQILVGDSGSEFAIDMAHIDVMRRFGEFSETGGLTVGACPSQILELTLRDVDNATIPRMGRLIPQIRIVSEDGETVSEWIDLGEFFVDTRLPDKAGGIIEITAYDAMRKGDSQLTSSVISSTRSMYAINLWSMCAHQIGTSAASLPQRYQATKLLGSDEIDTVRSTVGRMAGCFAGNAIISASGHLTLVSPTSSPVAEIDEGEVVSLGEPLPPVTRIVVQDSRRRDGDGIWSSVYGDDSGTTVYVEGTRFETQEGAIARPQAYGILSALSGLTYAPMMAENIDLDPALELGDIVQSGETTWMIYSMDVEYGRLVVGTIAAPAPSELEHEFPSRPAAEMTAECALREALDAQATLEDKLDRDLSNLSGPVSVSQGGTGQTSSYTTATVTPDTTSGASDHAINVRNYPYLAACFCRGYVKLSGVAITANTWVTVATVGAAAQPSASYPTPLAANTTVGGEARITASGEMQVRFYSDVPATATRHVYFSGWWTTNNA